MASERSNDDDDVSVNPTRLRAVAAIGAEHRARPHRDGEVPDETVAELDRILEEGRKRNTGGRPAVTLVGERGDLSSRTVPSRFFSVSIFAH